LPSPYSASQRHLSAVRRGDTASGFAASGFGAMSIIGWNAPCTIK